MASAVVQGFFVSRETMDQIDNLKCEWCGEPVDEDGECKNWDECGWCDIMLCTYDDHDCHEGDD